MTENAFMSGEDSPIIIYYAGKKTPSIMLSYLIRGLASRHRK